MTDYVATGLMKRRAEIAGEIAHTQDRMRQLAIDLEHLDATLRLVAPDAAIEAISPKLFRPPAHWSKRGEMSRVMLGILRVARNPLTSREIAAQMIVERGLVADTTMLNLMGKRCATALRALRDKGLIRSTEGPAGFWLLWEIAR